MNACTRLQIQPLRKMDHCYQTFIFFALYKQAILLTMGDRLFLNISIQGLGKSLFIKVTLLICAVYLNEFAAHKNVAMQKSGSRIYEKYILGIKLIIYMFTLLFGVC